MVLGVSLLGCKDELTTNDATKVGANTFIGSTAGLNQVLTSTYRAFLIGDPQEQPGASYQGVSGFLMLYDLMGSDCIVNKNYGSSPEPIYEFWSSRTMSTGDAHYIWETMYKAINEANIIIANVDNYGSPLLNGKKMDKDTDWVIDSIKCHMFPLKPAVPKYKAGWILTAADKICSVNEKFGKSPVTEEDRKELLIPR